MLLWNEDTSFTLSSFSLNHIVGSVAAIEDKSDLAGVYGFLDEQTKRRM